MVLNCNVKWAVRNLVTQGMVTASTVYPAPTKRILITVVTGFVDSALVKRFVQENGQITAAVLFGEDYSKLGS